MAKSLVPARAPWSRLVSICRECAGGSALLKPALKMAAKAAGRRDLRIVETSCLDVCPGRGGCLSITGANDSRSYVYEGAGALAPLVAALLAEPGSETHR